MSRTRRDGRKKKRFLFFFREKKYLISNFIKYLESYQSNHHKNLYLLGSLYKKQAHIIFIAGFNLYGTLDIDKYIGKFSEA